MDQLRSPVKLKAAQAVGKNKMRVPKCAKSKGQSKRKSKVSKGQDVYSCMHLPPTNPLLLNGKPQQAIAPPKKKQENHRKTTTGKTLNHMGSRLPLWVLTIYFHKRH